VPPAILGSRSPRTRPSRSDHAPDGPCGHQLRAKDRSAGDTVQCPGCGTALEVPRPESFDLEIATEPTAFAPHRKPDPAAYEYRMRQITPRVEVREGASHHQVAAGYLEKIVNGMAEDGWEFYRVDTLGITERPGCLSALLGQGPRTVSYYVATFRRLRSGR
jgi:hypothetical protein